MQTSAETEEPQHRSTSASAPQPPERPPEPRDTKGSCPPRSKGTLAVVEDSGMGVGRGVPRLLLEFSYLRVFQLSFSMWFSGPSLSKEAMKRAERQEDPQKPCPHTNSALGSAGSD